MRREATFYDTTKELMRNGKTFQEDYAFLFFDICVSCDVNEVVLFNFLPDNSEATYDYYGIGREMMMEHKSIHHSRRNLGRCTPAGKDLNISHTDDSIFYNFKTKITSR